jgi:hypothetical protein
VERRFRKGLAFQAFWVLANTLTETGSLPSSNTFLPGAVPADLDAANRFLNYRRGYDGSSSDHPMELGGGAALGKGKRFLAALVARSKSWPAAGRSPAPAVEDETISPCPPLSIRTALASSSMDINTGAGLP